MAAQDAQPLRGHTAHRRLDLALVRGKLNSETSEMNQAEFHIRTEQDGVLALQQAVLIYRGAQGSAFATVHDIEEINGEATILAGKAMTPRAAIMLSRELVKGIGHGGFIPETVLYMDGDLLLWWTRPRKRDIAFRAEGVGTAERGEGV